MNLYAIKWKMDDWSKPNAWVSEDGTTLSFWYNAGVFTEKEVDKILLPHINRELWETVAINTSVMGR